MVDSIGRERFVRTHYGLALLLARATVSARVVEAEAAADNWTAHWLIETGWGGNERANNPGNITARAGEPSVTYTDSHVERDSAGKLVNVRHTAGLRKWNTLLDGCAGYVQFVRERCPQAWRAATSTDGSYGVELRRASYFSGVVYVHSGETEARLDSDGELAAQWVRTLAAVREVRARCGVSRSVLGVVVGVVGVASLGVLAWLVT